MSPRVKKQSEKLKESSPSRAGVPRHRGRGTGAGAERPAREDVAAVKEPERDAEREQHEQVEVPQAQRPAKVAEAEQEEQAEAESDGGAAYFARAESARRAARHLPSHLRACPRLDDGTAHVLD